MLYHFALQMQSYYSLFHIVHYVSFRAMIALLMSFSMTLVLGRLFINWSKNIFQNGIRPFAPEGHKYKGATPTMGGCFILLVVLVNILMWCDWSKPELWLFILVLSGFGFIGLLDDLCKLWYKKGIYPRQKFILQVVIATIIAIAWIQSKNPSGAICVPFFKSINPDIGFLLIPWVIFILVGTSNAVNLTDGLDGLAIGSLLSNFSVFSIIAYVAGHYTFASYLHIPFSGTAEVAIVGGALIGASMGFLWFNAHPAQIFMGDVGSLSLGAALAMMAIMSRQELLLPIAGGLFVVEAISVIAQYIARKYYKTRILRMAPIHHHFELLGWKEPKITVRFNIISIMLCLLTLIIMKIR